MSPSLMVPNCTNEFKKLFVYESQKAAEDFLQKKKLNIDSTPILIPFRSAYGDIQFLKPSDGDKKKNGVIRIMGARNALRDKNLGGSFLDWCNRELLGRDFVPHLNDLEGDNILIEENGLIVIYQRAEKEGGARRIGAAFAELFRKQRDILREEIRRSDSNDAVRLNVGRFTEGLTELGMDVGGIDAGMTYFINKSGEVIRHTFKPGASKNIKAYLHAEPADVQEVRVNYNKTQDNHYVPFLKDWAKWTALAFITAIGAGFITSIFLAAFIAAPIAVITFVGLSIFACYKALKDNPKTTDHGDTEFETIKPEAAKQKNSIFNQLKSALLMLLAYFKGKSSADKQAVNPVAQSVQPEVAALESPLTEQAKVTPVEQNPIPRKLSIDHTTKEQSSTIPVGKPVAKVTPFLNAGSTPLFSKQVTSENAKNKKQSGGTSFITSFFKGTAKIVKKETKHAKGVFNDMFKSTPTAVRVK